MIPFCQESGIPVITYSSIAQGILTGKFGMVNEFQPGDHRKGTVFFDNDVWPHIYVGIEKLKKIANEAGLSLRDLAIQWVIHKSGISSVLIGARNSVQVSQNINSINAGYDNSILDKFTEVSNEIIKYVPDTGNIFRWYP
jgi:aryl-alcohol dehydrogenase-like predicted oxidoreductase